MLHKLREQMVRHAFAENHARLPWVGSIGLAIAVAITYFLAARLSLALLTPADGVAVFWPAAGIASGLLIAIGPAARVPIAVGVMAATVTANLLGDRNLGAAIFFALCNIGEATIIAWLIERYFGLRFSLDSFSRVVGLFVATVIGTAVSSIGGTIGIVLFYNSGAPVLTTWLDWFASDALGTVTVAPLVIGVARIPYDLPEMRERVEGTVALATLALVSAIGFGSPTDYWFTLVPLALLLPLLLWPAVHCRPVFAAAGVFILALAIVWTITFGIGRLGEPNILLSDRVHASRVTLLAISACALGLAALFAERRRNEAALKDSNDRQRLLVAELDHRVKNVLATVSVIASQTREASSSMEGFVTALDGRIRAMASAHELLSIRQWKGVPLAELIRRELAPYSTGNNTEIDGPDVMLSAETGQALAMVVHELVTNAVKYGAISSQSGRISVRWYRQLNGSNQVVLEWQETGGPKVEAPTKSGYGASVIRELIPYEFGGTVDLALHPEGVRCRLEIPAARLSSDSHQSEQLNGSSGSAQQSQFRDET